MTKDGTPIGPFLKVIAIKGDMVQTESLETNDTPMILIDNLYKCKVIRLQTKFDKLQTLKQGNCIQITYPVNKTWARICDEQYDVIVFCCDYKKDSCIYTYEYAKRVVTKKDNRWGLYKCMRYIPTTVLQVRIVLDRLIK